MVKRDLFVLLANLLLLMQNDIALAFNCATLKLGILEDVINDVKNLRDVPAETLGVVDCLFARGIGIEVTNEVCTKILNLYLECML